MPCHFVDPSEVADQRIAFALPSKAVRALFLGENQINKGP
jgi:hypothetical protein